MIFYLTAIANGFLNTINRMTNVKAGEVFGTTKGALINYVEATIIALCMIFVMGNGAELSFSHIKEVPFVFYLGSFLGLISMILTIIATNHTGAMVSTVLMLVGQMGISIVLDYVFFRTFSMIRVCGIFLIIMGIFWKEKQKAATRQEAIKASLATSEKEESQ